MVEVPTDSRRSSSNIIVVEAVVEVPTDSRRSSSNITVVGCRRGVLRAKTTQANVRRVENAEPACVSDKTRLL